MDISRYFSGKQRGGNYRGLRPFRNQPPGLRNSHSVARRQKRTKRAFSLIELILATTLTAIILSIVYGVFLASIESKKDLEEVQTLDRQAQGLFRRLSMELGKVPLYPGNQISLLGTLGSSDPRRDRIDFITTSPPIYQAEKKQIVHEVGYYLQSDSEGKTALYRREEEGTDFNLGQGGQARKILDNVESFEINYYFGGEWREQWNQKRLPPFIEVKLVLRKKGVASSEEGEENSEEEGQPGRESYRLILSLPTGSKRP